MARYPDIVALTRLLVIPEWRDQALSRESPMLVHPMFMAEVQRTVAPGFTFTTANDYLRNDPLYLWIFHERRNITMRRVRAARGRGEGRGLPTWHSMITRQFK
ncbi:hypothetical protein Ppa06_63300 [Planomonospora parontospora subsp. parontospora]|uniref:Uncharacterized protein n=2 Tax=Planomonospora parontospora TaxID=58119 RepID=A0AA37BPA4_9ACTN|nr:hypothetical protein [Planomonospora parontospora]GGL01162.1 hypothetical protein GCM10010126_70530 [Planomonospora parontospora]GII12532.1 hypothetical protein Ppa06_63300 [Planomonospora parontospora subsp. parontospora]